MKKFYILAMMGLAALSYSQVGTTCEDPIVITSLPYSTTDDTANYADNYDPSTSSNPACSTTYYGNYYHGGNDVIYSWTATGTGSIKIEMPNVVAWTGMFVYTSCEDIGINYAACATGSSAGTRTIDNFPVTAGQTYYILLSSWPSPQTFAYTLNVTAITLAVSENGTAKESSVYPNPVTDVLNFRSQSDIVSAKIYSIDGKIIGNERVTNNSVSVERLPKGMYIVEFTDKKGITSTKKFIKK